MRQRFRPRAAAFSLVELIVAATLLVVMFGFLLAIADQTTRIWSSSTAKVEQFRGARVGFERMTGHLSQATLNTYWDYNDPNAPTRYERRSELRFISGAAKTLIGAGGPPTGVTHAIFFNAPTSVSGKPEYRGLANALNTIGYFVEFGDDAARRPPFITDEMVAPQWHFRLMEFIQPTENFSLYQFTSGNPNNTSRAWFTDAGNAAMKRVAVENVVALIITPRLAKAEETPLQSNATHSPLAPDYTYDSTTTNASALLNPKNQLPPVVQITMVAIDDRSADRLDPGPGGADVLGVSSLFSDTRKSAEDLSALETLLAAKRARYRIFTTNVHIRAAKWSREQTN